MEMLAKFLMVNHSRDFLKSTNDVLSHLTGLLSIRGELLFENGEISKNIDLNLTEHEIINDISFIVCMLPPTGGAKLGNKSKALVRVFAEEGD